jgi:hypothetical protein
VLHVHGILQDSVAVDFVTVTRAGQLQPSTPIFERASRSFKPLEEFHGDDNIGKATKNGYFVKSATVDHRYSMCKINGFAYEYMYVDAAEMQALL